MKKRTLPSMASVAEHTGDAKLHAPSAVRNAPHISSVLAEIAPASGHALELASGTGEHMLEFASRLPGLIWQPTEVAADRLASIAAYLDEAGLTNILPPLELDACVPGWGGKHKADLIVLVNLLHLISTDEAQTLIGQAAEALNPNGHFLIYGPFMRGGELTSEGDESFHAALTAGDPEIGYKDDFDTMDWLEAVGLSITAVVEMPANNLSIIARRG